MRTRARIRYRKQERIHRQASERIAMALNADQRRILALSHQEYAPGEIARELALPIEYVRHFMQGLTQRLAHDGLIPSPDWQHVLRWATREGVRLDP